MRTSKQIFIEDRALDQYLKDIVDVMESSEQKEMDKYYNYHYKEAEKIIKNIKGRYSIETAGIILSAMLVILNHE